jgi:hypothetical protein
MSARCYTRESRRLIRASGSTESMRNLWPKIPRSQSSPARRLAHDHAERERAVVAVKTWLLAQIEKKRAGTAAANVETEQDEPLPSERLAA